MGFLDVMLRKEQKSKIEMLLDKQLVFFLFFSSEQQQKKLHQLEEKLDYEMQAKDELEQKCKYDWTSTILINHQKFGLKGSNLHLYECLIILIICKIWFTA